MIIKPLRGMFKGMYRGIFAPSDSSVSAGGGSGTFGQEAVGTATSTCENYILAARFQNDTGGTGTTATISIRNNSTDTAATAMKVAIYADAAGPTPGVLLGSSAEFNPSAYAIDWFDFEISLGANTIDSGSYYWLAMWANTGAFYYAREASGGTNAYKSIEYTGTWPSPMAQDDVEAKLYSIHCDITW